MRIAAKLRAIPVQINRLFQGRYLLATNTIVSGALFGVGDCFQQNIEIRWLKTHDQFDWKRTGRMVCAGTLLGPADHFWYKVLDKALPGRDIRTITKKILCDQLIAAPIFAFTFYNSVGLLEGHTFSRTWSEFKAKFPYIYAFDWCLWPPAQAINFYYVPSQYRVLYVNGIVLFWDIYMSYIKHKDQDKPVAALGRKEFVPQEALKSKISSSAVVVFDEHDKKA